jgi:hypothetical protein
MTDQLQCNSEYCPWDHDPSMCAECIEIGTLMVGRDPDVLADRLEKSQNLLEDQPLSEYQLEEIEMTARAGRMEQERIDYQRKIANMTAEERQEESERILKELGF